MTFRMLSRFFVICHLFICHWNEVPYAFMLLVSKRILAYNPYKIGFAHLLRHTEVREYGHNHS